MSNTIFFEIQVDNVERAVNFYKQVFNWDFIKDENLPIDYRRAFDENVNAGLLKRPSPIPKDSYGTNAFVCSFEVEDFDKFAEKVLKNGGQIALPKFAVPNKCWQGYFLDTENNTFGIFQVDENASLASTK